MFSLYLSAFTLADVDVYKGIGICSLFTVRDALVFHTVDVCDSITNSMSDAVQHLKLFVHIVSVFLIQPF